MRGGARPELECQRPLGGDRIDGDDRLGPDSDGPEQRCQPDAAQAPDRDALPGADARRIDDRADPGQHRAAEQRGDLGRHAGVDDHGGPGIDDGMIGKRRQSHVVMHAAAALAQPRAATDKVATAVRRRRLGT